MRVPFGALPGFSFNADVREIAAYYSVTARQIRRRDSRERGSALEARHALMWKLSAQRGLDDRKIARLLDCRAETVRDGIAAHARRITDFHETMAPAGSSGVAAPRAPTRAPYGEGNDR